MNTSRTYSSAIEHAANYTRWVLDAFSGYFGRNLLEVGLGHGGYRQFLPPVDQYVGVDIDRSSVETARARAPQDEFICADISRPEFVEAASGREIDTVLCVNVLEHVPDDTQAVSNLIRILRPEGHVLIFVPAMPVLYGSLDRLAGHHRRYTRASLSALVRLVGGRVVSARYFNAVGAVGWWCNGFVQHRSLDEASINRQIRFFDRFVVPVARIADFAFRDIFGQSLTVIVRKNS